MQRRPAAYLFPLDPDGFLQASKGWKFRYQVFEIPNNYLESQTDSEAHASAVFEARNHGRFIQTQMHLRLTTGINVIAVQVGLSEPVVVHS